MHAACQIANALCMGIYAVVETFQCCIIQKMAVLHPPCRSSLFLVVTLLVFRSSPALPHTFFIFGDSLVDVGNNDYLVTLSKANAPPYGVDFAFSGGKPTGRFTNGRTIADVIGNVKYESHEETLIFLSRSHISWHWTLRWSLGAEIFCSTLLSCKFKCWNDEQWC